MRGLCARYGTLPPPTGRKGDAADLAGQGGTAAGGQSQQGSPAPGLAPLTPPSRQGRHANQRSRSKLSSFQAFKFRLCWFVHLEDN